MAAIPDISDTERWVTQTRSGSASQEVAFELAGSDVRLHPSDRDVALCPLTYRQSEAAS